MRPLHDALYVVDAFAEKHPVISVQLAPIYLARACRRLARWLDIERERRIAYKALSEIATEACNVERKNCAVMAETYLADLRRADRYAEALQALVDCEPDYGNSKRSAYLEHGSICACRMEWGEPCECGLDALAHAFTIAREALEDK